MSYGSAPVENQPSHSKVSLVPLIQKQPIKGIFQVIPAEAITELAGRAGADFVVIDGEHGTFSIATLESMVRTGEAAGISVLYRAASLTDDLSKALDTGIAGLVVPRIESAAEAQAVVQASRFPPAGARGVGPGRASFYGMDMQKMRKEANQKILLVVMIETRKGLDNLESIAAVKGVDVIMIGPADLASSMDVSPGSEDHASAVQVIKEAALAAGKHAGIHCANREDAIQREQEGFRFLPISLDAALLFGSLNTVFNED